MRTTSSISITIFQSLNLGGGASWWGDVTSSCIHPCFFYIHGPCECTCERERERQRQRAVLAQREYTSRCTALLDVIVLLREKYQHLCCRMQRMRLDKGSLFGQS